MSSIKPYTPWELSLFERYAELGAKGIANMTGRTYAGVFAKARALGKWRNRDDSEWTEKEDAIVMENLATKGAEWCANQVNRSPSSCKKRYLRIQADARKRARDNARKAAERSAMAADPVKDDDPFYAPVVRAHVPVGSWKVDHAVGVRSVFDLGAV